MIKLFVHIWNKFFQTSQRVQSMVTLFESPKEIKEKQTNKQTKCLVFMALHFIFHSTLKH